jgi:hypothetical protein
MADTDNIYVTDLGGFVAICNKGLTSCTKNYFDEDCNNGSITVPVNPFGITRMQDTIYVGLSNSKICKCDVGLTTCSKTSATFVNAYGMASYDGKLYIAGWRLSSANKGVVYSCNATVDSCQTITLTDFSFHFTYGVAIG